MQEVFARICKTGHQDFNFSIFPRTEKIKKRNNFKFQITKINRYIYINRDLYWYTWFIVYNLKLFVGTSNNKCDKLRFLKIEFDLLQFVLSNKLTCSVH